MKRIALALIIFQLSIASAFAESTYGGRLSYVAIAKEPPHLRGYQALLTYEPHKFNWDHWHLYFDGGFAYFSDGATIHHSSINIYSIAPILRYAFNKQGPVLPYFEVSIGLSYLNHTRIEKRNLGIHFAFQDRIGIGALLGASEQLSIGLHAVHYSNARFSGRNSGITIPLMLDIGYRFN